jgi:hypothetical protein
LLPSDSEVEALGKYKLSTLGLVIVSNDNRESQLGAPGTCNKGTNMSNTNDGLAQTPLKNMENFRATATAFAQLTGVLGGFSITILVLVLSATSLESHKTARDWTVGLLLFAAVTYISSSGLLANSMNRDAFLVLAKKWGKPQSDVFLIQQQAFNNGIMLFHAGNILLSAAIFIIVYQASLLVGIVVSIVIVFVVIIVVIINIVAPLGRRNVHGDTTTKDNLNGPVPKDPGLS